MTVPAPDLPQARIETVAEALYALLPVHVRQRDIAAGGGLRALIGVLARSSAEIDAETDAFYDALFVETAPEAALAQIGALVGAPLLRPMPPGSGIGSRALVANTIRYRRGKGTARVVEDLAADVTGLAALAVEYYQRLSRLAHLIDPRPERPALALLVPGDSAARAGSGLDALPRLLDLRRIAPSGRRGPAGRHGIAELGLHLLRAAVPAFPAPEGTALAAADLAGVPVMRPWAPGGVAQAGFFQLSAQPERMLRLFNPDRSADAAAGRPGATDLPDRLRRLPLHAETEERRAAAIEGRAPQLPARPWFDGRGNPFTLYLRRGAGGFVRVPPERLRIVNLETPPAGRPAATLTHRWFAPGPVLHDDPAPIDCAFDPVTGRLVTPAPADPADEVTEVRIACGTGIGRPIGAGPQDRNDPDELFDLYDEGGLTHVIRLVDAEAPETGAAGDARRSVATLAKALAEVKALGAGKRSVILCLRCGIEPGPGGPAQLVIWVHPESELHLLAAQWRDPIIGPGAAASLPLGFIVRRDRRLTLDAPVVVRRATTSAAKRAGTLVIDGVEFVRGMKLAVGSVGDCRIRHSTIRAPGAVALTATGGLTAATVTLDSVLCGPVRLGSAAISVTGGFTASDSLFAADGAAMPALDLPDMDTALCNVTLLGTASLRALDATNVLFDGAVAVTRRQSGCVRYSYAPPGAQLPRAFRCQPDLALAAAAAAKGAALSAAERLIAAQSVTPVYLDRDLDEPLVAMLHPLCPEAIRSGGEDGAGMGCFSAAAFGIARDNLQSLFPEFLPYALDAGVIDDSRSGIVAARRNRP